MLFSMLNFAKHHLDVPITEHDLHLGRVTTEDNAEN